MISKDLLKSINSLIVKKSFSPALTQFMYYKEFDTFLATDSCILLEIKNPFDPFDSDFCIDGIDMKTIKNDILAMSKDHDLVNVICKDKDYVFRTKKDIKQPPYKQVIEQYKQEPIDNIVNSTNYKQFFEIADNLRFDKIQFSTKFLVAKNDNLFLMARIGQVY